MIKCKGNGSIQSPVFSCSVLSFLPGSTASWGFSLDVAVPPRKALVKMPIPQKHLLGPVQTQQFAHFGLDHVYCNAVATSTGNDKISIALGRLNELKIHGTNSFFVLGQDRIQGAVTFVDVALQAADEADIQGGFHENANIHEVTEFFFDKKENALHNNNGVLPDSPGGFFTKMKGMAVNGYLNRLAGQQGKQLRVEEIVVHGIRVVVVDFGPFFKGDVAAIPVPGVFGDDHHLAGAQFIENGIGEQAFAGR